VSASEIGPLEVCVAQVGLVEPGAGEMGVPEFCAMEVGAPQVQGREQRLLRGEGTLSHIPGQRHVARLRRERLERRRLGLTAPEARHHDDQNSDQLDHEALSSLIAIRAGYGAWLGCAWRSLAL